MRSRRDAVLLGAVLLFLIVIAVVAGPDERASRDDPRPSTYRTGPNGARALLLLVREYDISAQPALRPWTAGIDADVLVVLAPVQEPTDGEVKELLEWTRAGGTLIYGAGAGGDPVLRGLGLAVAARGGADETFFGVPARTPLADDTADSDVLLSGVDRVPGFGRRFARAGSAFRDGAETLLRSEAGDPLLVRVPLEDGAAYVWSDAAALSNGRVRADPAAALVFIRTVMSATESWGVVAFDEYHHGFRDGSPLRALVAFLGGSGAGRGLLQLAVAGLVLLLLFGRRFGAPLQEHAGRRRSPLEHVDALAAAYRRAGAERTARRLLLAGLERRLGRRLVNNEGALGATSESAAGRRLAREWERGGLAALAGAIDEFAAEVRQWGRTR